MTIHGSWRIVLALTCLTLPQMSAAQVVATGARVRVVDAATGTPLLTGELIRMAGDTVIVSSAAATPTVFVVGAKHRLEISTGTHRNTLRGIRSGAVIGIATGALIGLATYQEPDCSQTWFCFDFGPAANAFGGAFVGSIPGMVIGGIIGANSPSETWQRQ